MKRVTQEQKKEYSHRYQKAYRQAHPDRLLLYKLRAKANELRKIGYIVTDPPAEELTATIAEYLKERGRSNG